MLTTLRHWFTPHHTNNYRAKILHHSSLFILILIIFVVIGFTKILETSSSILGITAHITPQQIILQTNQERVQHGLPPLQSSPQLTLAAQHKAQHMFAHNYWAHFSPTGKTPWDFILDAGYDYLYAGENLAKGFNNVDSLLKAWMYSPTHKANILSSQYHDIGVAVATGTLKGRETILVVQLFGTLSSSPSVKTTSTLSSHHTASLPLIAQTTLSSAPFSRYFFDLNTFKKTFAYLLACLLIITLLIDFIVANHYNLSRYVGNNLAHLIFINFLLLLFNFLSFGSIL